MNKEKNLSYLVLIRHGQSEWNKKNLFTGWKNPPLTEKGIEEAELAGIRIKNLNIDFSHYFTSALIRAQETGEIILNQLEKEKIIKTRSQNLNETLANNLNIPLIASGGAGELNHLVDAIKIGKADAVLAASIFHYKEISIRKVKEVLKREGLEIRL